MRALHLFFQLHRPYEIKTPENFDQGYFGGEAEFREIEQSEYQPFFALLERNMQRHAKLKLSLAVSGPWLEQAEKWSPLLLRRLRKLVETGRVEILAQPYYHSLAAFYDKTEFAAQVELFQKKAKSLLGADCQGLCLPELIYHDKIAKWAEEKGFQVVMAGEADRILGWRSANYVYEASGCEKVKILFQNSALSRAVRLGEQLVMVEGRRELALDEAENEGQTPTEVTSAEQAKLTAAEFVRGMSGAKATKTPKTIKNLPPETLVPDGKWSFSAQKLQKELELACLRGNLLSLCLDTGIFRVYREQGVVALFDELFANWLKGAGNRLVTASELAMLQPPRAAVSVKTTINWRGEREQPSKAGLVAAKEVRYCPPDWLRSAEQVQMQRELYGLRTTVLGSSDEQLKADFGRLTSMDYLLLFKTTAPAVVGAEIAPFQATTLENFQAALANFRGRLPILKLPEKAAEGESAEPAAKPTAAPADEDHTVVVHRVKRATQPSVPVEEPAPVDPDKLEMDEWQDVVSDAADDAEAELQIMMQRMSRAKEEASTVELDQLAEAEVVVPEVKETTKKRKKKRIVLE